MVQLEETADGSARTARVIRDLPFEELLHLKLLAHFEDAGEAGLRDLHAFVVGRVERALIRLALERCDGNRVRAAELLGLHRNTLRRKMRELGW